MPVGVIDGFYCRIQFRGCLDLPPPQIGDKCRVNASPIFVRDICANWEVVAGARRNGEKRQRRGEKEIPDIVLLVKPADLREDGKRRVVDHHAALRVVLVLVVAARVKRAEDRSVFQAVVLHRPIPDRLVDVFRGVAVVRSQLPAELIHKGVVFLIRLRLSPIVAPEMLRRVLLAPGLFPVVLPDVDGLARLQVEAREGDVKVQGGDLVQFEAQGLLVPPGVLCQAVVGQDVRPALGLRKTAHPHAGHALHALGLGRQQPPVPGDHPPLLVDEDGGHKAELPQAPAQPLHLLVAVRPGVVLIRHQLRHRHGDKLLGADPHDPGRLAFLPSRHVKPPVPKLGTPFKIPVGRKSHTEEGPRYFGGP